MNLNLEVEQPLYQLGEEVRDIVSRKRVTVRSALINITATQTSSGLKTSVLYTYVCEYENGWLCELAQDFIEPTPVAAAMPKLPKRTKPKQRKRRS